MLRIGSGDDVHKLVEGRPLILGGVDIPHSLGLLGHSDADVLSHAISDALLGSVALGDLGHHFPDADPQFSGADSIELLGQVGLLLKEVGAKIVNVDSTIFAEKPKLAPHTPYMRKNIAETLDIAVGTVSVKATTTERLGFVGRGECIAANAVVLVEVGGFR